jgi:hypothetical protein
MPIRPFEVITSQEASQIKHMETQRAQHSQEQIAKNFQTLVKQEHQKPVQTTKTENTEYRYDAKEKGNNQYYNSNGKKKDKEKDDTKKETKNETKKSPKSGGFDILI